MSNPKERGIVEMSFTTHQKKRVQGKKVALFIGLAEDVSNIVKRLENVNGVSCAAVRKYHGERKVKMSWGGNRPFLVIVCDAEYGERHLCIDTKKPGAVSRILRKRLAERGICVLKGKTMPRAIAA